MPAGSVVDQVFGKHASDVAPTGVIESGRGIQKPRLNALRNARVIRLDDAPPSMMSAQLRTDKACYALAQILFCDARKVALSSQDPRIPEHSMQIIDWESDRIALFVAELKRIDEKRRGYVNELRSLYGDDTGPDFNLDDAEAALLLERQMGAASLSSPTPLNPQRQMANAGSF